MTACGHIAILMSFLQQATYRYEIFIEVPLHQADAPGGPSSSKLRDDSHRRQAMRSLLIAIPTLLTLSFGAWALLVLVVLEH